MTAQVRPERAIGQIHVYDGMGKGKSQAALGVVLRSLGLGMAAADPKETRILLIRFLKGPGREYAEDAAIAALQQGFPT
jgi:cob(I)alamin adenosyltransferase